MKSQTVVIASICLALALIMSPSASMATAEVHSLSVVELNWTTFAITTDLGVSLSWNSQSSSISAMGGSITDSVGDWTSSLPTVAIPFGAGGSAAVSEGLLQVYSGANMTPPETGYVLADFIASRYGDFTVSGSGLVTFSVDALIAQTASFTGGLPDWSYVGGFADLSLMGAGGVSGDSFMNEILQISSGSDSFSGTKTLSVSMFFDNGQTGSLFADAYSATRASSVPEPSSMLLLGLGLAGMLGFGKKKVKTT